jgi:hypothetical protein
LDLLSVYHFLVPLESVSHGKEGKKGGHIFHKGGMNPGCEAEVQILTQPLDARFQGRIINRHNEGPSMYKVSQGVFFDTIDQSKYNYSINMKAV